jgi:XTP/dITP diphosphohydrolase
VVEDAATFAGNARKKAVVLAEWLGKANRNPHELPANAWVLADDSGLEVDALGGAPGVHSARFAAKDSGGDGNSPDAANNAKLLRLLAHTPAEQRTARFRCVLALTPVLTDAAEVASPVCYASGADMLTCLFDGTCEGTIAKSPCGQGGFGYDPLFVPLGFQQSFAELGEEVKNRLSHRAKALVQLRAHLLASRVAG